jgi:hypothetical protein
MLMDTVEFEAPHGSHVKNIYSVLLCGDIAFRCVRHEKLAEPLRSSQKVKHSMVSIMDFTNPFTSERALGSRGR